MQPVRQESPQLFLSVPILLSWDCCGYPKHGQAFSQVCLFGDVFSRNITKHFGLSAPNAILTSERQKEWKRMVTGTLWNNVFLLVLGKNPYTKYRQHTWLLRGFDKPTNSRGPVCSEKNTRPSSWEAEAVSICDYPYGFRNKIFFSNPTDI